MPPLALSTATVVVRNGGFSEAAVDQEIVAFSIEKGACFGFNPVGSRIWQLVANPITVDSICNELVREYEIDPETCKRDVISFLEQLFAEGMVGAPRQPNPGSLATEVKS